MHNLHTPYSGSVKRVSKADQIRALAAQGHTPRVIAELVWGLASDAAYKDVDRKMAYVRVTLRQRKGGTSKNDKTYKKKKFGAATIREAWRIEHAIRYANNPAYRAKQAARLRASRQRKKAEREARP